MACQCLDDEVLVDVPEDDVPGSQDQDVVVTQPDNEQECVEMDER